MIARFIHSPSSRRRNRPSWTFRNAFVVLLFLLYVSSTVAYTELTEDGPSSVRKGKELFQQGQYEESSMYLWRGVLLHGETPPALTYNVQEVFTLFMQCYIVQDRMADGFAFIALESFRRGQTDMGENYLKQALQVDPSNPAAVAVAREFGYNDGQEQVMGLGIGGGTDDESAREEEAAEFVGKSPEQLYEIASGHFSDKNYEECADIFELSCARSDYKLGPSCANAVYCRTMIVDYGFNGTLWESDMLRIEQITRQEVHDFSVAEGQDGKRAWRRATSVHPHMTLGYPIDPVLKRYITESVAFLDETMARAHGGTLTPLPADLPYSLESYHKEFLDEVTSRSDFRIRVGFVGSGFNSKAVLFLSQDMFRFFDPAEFEIHVFSFGPPDSRLFIQHGMRGVDWRERVKSNVDYFHDMQPHKNDHIAAARFIHDQKIHMLIEWDGFARQGERAQGLFALRPAPVQILHQEYLGTSGAHYVDYLFTDQVASPPATQDLYTEKLIYMPNHFFSKGHAFQAEVKQPTYEYAPKQTPYELGTGRPQENRCLAPDEVGPANVSFVFCNFNKLLKANPETIRSWIRILREVPNSMLCLLENPDTAIPYLRRFVHEAAGTSNGDDDPDSFQPGDGDELNERIHFLPWQRNPFDHQTRNQDFCNLMLDSTPYNGHTVAQDSLYGGVPIVTRSDRRDMSSRVTTSANLVLGLEELTAEAGPTEYEDIAIRVGSNTTLYNEIRTRLIDTALQRNPMHPYWDVGRYAKNFEEGLRIAWDRFLAGKDPDHIVIVESPEAMRGSYDEDVAAHPTEGRLQRGGQTLRSDEL